MGRRREAPFTAKHVFSDGLKIATSGVRENRKYTMSREYQAQKLWLCETIGCGHSNMELVRSLLRF